MQNQKVNNSALGAAVAGAVVGAAATAAVTHFSDKKNRDALVNKAKEVNKKFNDFTKESKGRFDDISEDVSEGAEKAKHEAAKTLESQEKSIHEKSAKN